MLEILPIDPFLPSPAADRLDTLRRTIPLFGDRLAAIPCCSSTPAASGCTKLPAKIVTGWVEAAHDQILATQDDLCSAVDTARATGATMQHYGCVQVASPLR